MAGAGRPLVSRRGNRVPRLRCAVVPLRDSALTRCAQDRTAPTSIGIAGSADHSSREWSYSAWHRWPRRSSTKKVPLAAMPPPAVVDHPRSLQHTDRLGALTRYLQRQEDAAGRIDEIAQRQVHAAWNPPRTSVVSPPRTRELLGRQRIDQTGTGIVDGGEHLLLRRPPALSRLADERADAMVNRTVVDGPALGNPFLETPIEHPHVARTRRTQGPPDPRGHHRRRGCIDDDRRILIRADGAQPFGDRSLRGQAVRRRPTGSRQIIEQMQVRGTGHMHRPIPRQTAVDARRSDRAGRHRHRAIDDDEPRIAQA